MHPEPTPPTAEVTAFLAERHPRMLELSPWVRAVVLAAEPDLVERVYRGWDGVGFRHPDGGFVCAIYPREDEVQPPPSPSACCASPGAGAPPGSSISGPAAIAS